MGTALKVVRQAYDAFGRGDPGQLWLAPLPVSGG